MGAREGGFDQSHGCDFVSQRILQFDASRFLQAQTDLFVRESRCAGQDIGPTTILKTTTGGARDARVRFRRRRRFPSATGIDGVSGAIPHPKSEAYLSHRRGIDSLGFRYFDDDGETRRWFCDFRSPDARGVCALRPTRDFLERSCSTSIP